MSKVKELSAKKYHQKLQEIEAIKLVNVLDEILKAYMDSEHIQPKSGGWPGVTAFYNPRGEYIMFPKITVSYVPEEELEEDEIEEYSKDELCTKKLLDNEEFRAARLRNEIIAREEDVLRGYKSCQRNKCSLKKETKTVKLEGRDELVDFLKNEFFEKLNTKLKKEKLPRLDFTYIEYEPAEDIEEEDGKTYSYLECVHFNIENWSTHKLTLFGNKGINNGTHDLSRTYPVEAYILDMIEEAKEWVHGMPEKQLKKLLEQEPQFKSR